MWVLYSVLVQILCQSSSAVNFLQGMSKITPCIMPSTHRRPRRDETVESRRVGGVYTNSQLVGDSFVVSSVWTHPSAVVNWVTTDGCVVRSHRRIRRQSSRIHVHTADATRQNSFVASASAVCIGHYFYLTHSSLQAVSFWLHVAAVTSSLPASCPKWTRPSTIIYECQLYEKRHV